MRTLKKVEGGEGGEDEVNQEGGGGRERERGALSYCSHTVEGRVL